MLKLIILTAALAAAPALAASPASSPPIQVMVLGTYHMGNPGQDLNNLKADDVTTAKRQAELAKLADALARYKPTRILIERETKGPGFEVADYTGFKPAMLATSRNETTQIGYRLANRLGMKAVYGIDEQTGPGEPDYFPFDKVGAYAGGHGQGPLLGAQFAPVQAFLKDFETRQPKSTIAELLIMMNDDKGPTSGIAPYYGLLRFGDGDAQPGADLNAGWYLRNAKIFAKLINVAQPGDRLLVIYGSGHNYWLRHFATETPGFAYVDPLPYLRSVKR